MFPVRKHLYAVQKLLYTVQKQLYTARKHKNPFDRKTFFSFVKKNFPAICGYFSCI